MSALAWLTSALASSCGEPVCVDNALAPQSLLADGASTPATLVLAAPRGTLWWLPIAEAPDVLEQIGGDAEQRAADVVFASGALVAVRVPADVDVGSSWRIDGLPATLTVLDPAFAAPALTPDELTPRFRERTTFEYQGSYCTAAFEAPPPARVLPQLVFDTSIGRARLGGTILDVWLLEPGADPAAVPEDGPRAVKELLLVNDATAPIFPRMTDDDGALHLAPADVDGTMVVRLRDAVTAEAGPFVAAPF